MSKNKVFSKSDMFTYSSIGIQEEQLTNDSGNPLDVLVVKVKGIKEEEQEENYTVDVSFCNNTNIISAAHIQAMAKDSIIDDDDNNNSDVIGTILYDPSDYEKYSLFANYPLIVTAFPIKYDSILLKSTQSVVDIKKQKSFLSRKANNMFSKTIDSSLYQYTYSCNIDIVSLFIDKDILYIEKRLEPTVKPALLKQKSWENLPILLIEISIKRNPLNKRHHDIFKLANYMRLTMVGLFNFKNLYLPNFRYTISTQMPLNNDKNFDIFQFGNGLAPLKAVTNKLIPAWESLKKEDEAFFKGDDMLELTPDNDNDYEKYVNEKDNCIIWNTFHRTFMFGKTIDWFTNMIRDQKWPLELHVNSDTVQKSFSLPLNLFPLLYPEENKLTLALPLQLIPNRYSQDSYELQRKGGLLSKQASLAKASQKQIRSVHSFKKSDASDCLELMKADGNDIFILLDVTLYKPLQAISIPPVITPSEINNMLQEFENQPHKRKCTGRGRDKNWLKTVELSAASLKRVPNFGTNDALCTFLRQLAETRTRVEITSSFCQDAARYVNDNFIIDHHIQSNESYDELLLTAHICLMKDVNKSLLKIPKNKFNPILRAARHSRQLQDIKHARRLYMQVIVHQPNDSNIWRELGTCLKDLDIDCAYVCMQRALEIDSRHPLNLLSMGCLALEDNVEESETFFEAILHLYPFYTSLWYIAHCYYIKRSMFAVADKITELILLNLRENMCKELPFGRKWEDELGDWWDPTPVQIEGNGLYDAADLLLRIRALNLADVAVAQTLKNNGENAAYFHLLALCCRLRGEVDQAHCHLLRGREKCGLVYYLMTLEAECLLRLGNQPESMELFENAGIGTNPYNILVATPNRKFPQSRSVLIDLVGDHPSAYAWMALANDFMQNGDISSTENKLNITECALQALKIDRSFARAWALMANLTSIKERRKYFKEMALSSGLREAEKFPKFHRTANTCCKNCILRQECHCD